MTEASLKDLESKNLYSQEAEILEQKGTQEVMERAMCHQISIGQIKTPELEGITHVERDVDPENDFADAHQVKPLYQ